MKMHQEFIIAHPIAQVWDFFHDMPKLATCLPGAEYLGPTENGRHAGKVSAKVGPFQASFEGDAEVKYDEELKRITLEGKGVDKKGASRGKMVMNCELTAVGTSTNVAVDSDVQLSGTIAQFGRIGLIVEIANVLVADFVRNAEAEMTVLSAPTVPGTGSSSPTGPQAQSRLQSRPISGFWLLIMSVRAWIRSWFRRSA